MNAHLPKLANVESLHWAAPETTADIFHLLGEILEPSYRGPFGVGFKADAQYEAFQDALIPVADAYRAAFDTIRNTVESNRD